CGTGCGSRFHQSNALRDLVDGAVRGKRSAFLPREQMAAEVAGEVNPIIRFHERLIWTFVILAARSGNPGPLVERYLFPNDVHWTAQILSVSRMQSFNGGARRGYFGFEVWKLIEGWNALHAVSGE